jgi:uncharacterized protein YjbI with pentapeptide repeats
MNKDFQNIINQYRTGQLEDFQIRNQSFSTGTIANEALELSVFINVNFLDVNFTNVDFASSFFTDCSLQNCIFDRTLLRDAQFRNCSLKNCCLRNCNLIKADFRETIFDNCSFEKTEEEKGNLAKAWFESCHFLETNFNGFGIVPLIETAVVDSKFSKFNKSIEFKGEFFLSDILHPDNGLEGMFIES